MNTEQIWQQFHSKLRGYITRKVNDPEVADDILQDVFLKIHQNGRKLPEVTNVQAWIYKVTYNQIIDHFRAQKTSNLLPEEIPSEHEDHGEHHELAKCMVPFIKKLPSKYQNALMKTDLGGSSQKEYADEVGISYTGAKSRVQRARKQLKDIFTDCCNIHVDKYGTVMDYHSRT